MSEGITHTAVVDDCARLAVHAPDMCGAVKLCLAEHRDVARLGGITRHGDRHTVGLLTSLRDRWPPGEDTSLAPKLAFVLGWLAHRAADRQMKPLFRRLDPDCPRSPTDCSVYHDVCVLGEVYGPGTRFPPELLGDPHAAEDALCAAWQRMLLRMHTFIPDDQAVESWLDQVIALRQRLRVDLRRYAEALARPDPEKVRRFLTEPCFYHAADPLLLLARALQRDEAPPMGLTEALAAEPRSHYARAVRRAYGYVQAASAFFDREVDEGELRHRLEIGRPELAG
ncbi:MAG: hypothetical protein ACODAJ_03580 [Planctomycetota bacterium]